MRATKAGILLALALGGAVCVSASAGALPDNRVYEVVTPVAEEGSLTPVGGYSSRDGTAVDWEAIGGLGDATSGGINFFQSRRTNSGWQTTSLTPRAPTPLGALESQAPMFWSPDLSQTIFLTPASYAPGDEDHGALDLYLASTGGQVTWISRGPQGGNAPNEVTFDGATPDAGEVAFSAEESLTSEAVGLTGSDHDYLYVRDVQTGETHLVDVNNSGELLDPEGAILGNGTTLAFGEPPYYTYLAADYSGTTTNAISGDGSKVFFESPPPGAESATHLYMREDNSRTVAIDDPGSSGSAQYEGAAEDGSRVFFTSDEGLAGDPNTDREIYEYDTRTQTLTAISGGSSGTVDGNVVGVSAIANDGSHVYFVARGVLAPNMSEDGEVALEGAPNLYVYDAENSRTTFIANLSTSGGAQPELGVEPLVAEPDVDRSAYPTPNGKMLVFESGADLTGQNTSEYFEIYRYDAESGALICISCTSAGVTPSGDATLGGSGGGSYAPPSQAVPMSENASRIFFESPDPLVAEDTNPDRPPESSTRGETEVYEWENGQVSLISDGHAAVASGLDGTTPSGDDVFFTTSESLVPADLNPGYLNIYDARVLKSGEAPPPSAGEATSSASCSGPECRGPSAPAPSFLPPASASLQGASNVTPTVPKATADKSATHKRADESKGKKKKKKKKKLDRHAKLGKRAGRAAHGSDTQGKVG